MKRKEGAGVGFSEEHLDRSGYFRVHRETKRRRKDTGSLPLSHRSTTTTNMLYSILTYCLVVWSVHTYATDTPNASLLFAFWKYGTDAIHGPFSCPLAVLVCCLLSSSLLVTPVGRIDIGPLKITANKPISSNSYATQRSVCVPFFSPYHYSSD